MCQKYCIGKFMRTLRILFGWLFVVQLLIYQVSVFADEGEKKEKAVTEFPFSKFRNYLKERVECNIKALTYGNFLAPADSTQNPGNNFLSIPRYQINLELRPDISMYFDPLYFSFKPRANLEYNVWKEGGREGDREWDDDWYMNEWLARLQLTENLFVSYGRENLQWGPSYLLSPSNPFFISNGRNNPKKEIPGMDFARMVWLPNSKWSISLIANLKEGHNKEIIRTFANRNFKKTYAIKTDYVGNESYGSIIVSHREGDKNRIGYYGGLTATDALLIYSEGNISKGTNKLYPYVNNHPFGISMNSKYYNNSELMSIILFGGSYTLEIGPTLTFEYIYNSYGYTGSDSVAYYDLRKRASKSLNSVGPLNRLAKKTLNETLNNGLRLLNRNYAMIQYSQNDIRDVLNLTFRWTQNLDDSSGQFISIVGLYFGDNLELFSIGNINSGDQRTEFGSILDYQWMIGLEYTF